MVYIDFPLEEYKLTTSEVCSLLGYTYKYLCQKTRKGELPAKKVGNKWLYCKKELELMVKTSTRKATAPRIKEEDLSDEDEARNLLQ